MNCEKSLLRIVSARRMAEIVFALMSIQDLLTTFEFSSPSNTTLEMRQSPNFNLSHIPGKKKPFKMKKTTYLAFLFPRFSFLRGMDKEKPKLWTAANECTTYFLTILRFFLLQSFHNSMNRIQNIFTLKM